MISKVIERDKTSNLISLELLQQHIRQTDAYDQEIMQVYVEAAIDYCERYTNRFFTEALLLSNSEEFKERFLLSYDVNEVVSVEAKNNETEQYEEIEYRFNLITCEVILSKKYKAYTDFNIKFKSGYIQGELPKALIQGVLMLFGTLYEVREDVSYGVSAVNVPFRSEMLLDSYRLLSTK